MQELTAKVKQLQEPFKKARQGPPDLGDMETDSEGLHLRAYRWRLARDENELAVGRSLSGASWEVLTNSVTAEHSHLQ